MCRHVRDVDAVIDDGSGASLGITTNRHHQRGLARTVGTDHRDNFTAVDVYIDPPQGDDLSVVGFYSTNCEQRVRRRHACWFRPLHGRAHSASPFLDVDVLGLRGLVGFAAAFVSTFLVVVDFLAGFGLAGSSAMASSPTVSITSSSTSGTSMSSSSSTPR